MDSIWEMSRKANQKHSLLKTAGTFDLYIAHHSLGSVEQEDKCPHC